MIYTKKIIIYFLLLFCLFEGFQPYSVHAITPTFKTTEGGNTNIDIDFTGKNSDVAASAKDEKGKIRKAYNKLAKRLTILAAFIFGICMFVVLALGRINATRIAMTSSSPMARKNGIMQFMLCMIALALLGGAGTIIGLVYQLFR